MSETMEAVATETEEAELSTEAVSIEEIDDSKGIEKNTKTNACEGIGSLACASCVFFEKCARRQSPDSEPDTSAIPTKPATLENLLNEDNNSFLVAKTMLPKSDSTEPQKNIISSSEQNNIIKPEIVQAIVELKKLGLVDVLKQEIKPTTENTSNNTEEAVELTNDSLSKSINVTQELAAKLITETPPPETVEISFESESNSSEKGLIYKKEIKLNENNNIIEPSGEISQPEIKDSIQAEESYTYEVDTVELSESEKKINLNNTLSQPNIPNDNVQTSTIIKESHDEYKPDNSEGEEIVFVSEANPDYNNQTTVSPGEATDKLLNSNPHREVKQVESIPSEYEAAIPIDNEFKKLNSQEFEQTKSRVKDKNVVETTVYQNEETTYLKPVRDFELEDVQQAESPTDLEISKDSDMLEQAVQSIADEINSENEIIPALCVKNNLDSYEKTDLDPGTNSVSEQKNTEIHESKVDSKVDSLSQHNVIEKSVIDPTAVIGQQPNETQELNIKPEPSILQAVEENKPTSKISEVNTDNQSNDQSHANAFEVSVAEEDIPSKDQIDNYQVEDEDDQAVVEELETNSLFDDERQEPTTRGYTIRGSIGGLLAAVAIFAHYKNGLRLSV